MDKLSKWGGYSNNWGWNPTPACFYLVSLTEKESCLGRIKGKQLAELTGRVSEKMMKEVLEEKTK